MDRTILVVDDEERLARSLQELLSEEGYEVDCAVGGPGGIEALKKKHYRVVITDLRMPEIDGFQLIDFVSSHYPNTAVIVITGHASTQSAIEAIHLRVADYLTKPFEFDFLLASIEKVFAQIDADEVRQDMMRMISHDIKVPLNSIMGFSQFIIDRRTGQPSERAGEFAEKITANCQRILGLLDNYLTQARAESGKLEILPQPFRLQDTLEEAARMVAAEFQRRRIEFAQRIDEKAPMWSGDEHLIFRAVSNLLSNAAKYTPEEGQAELVHDVQERGDLGKCHVISVRNTGPGIAEEERAHVFQRYHRTSSSQGTEGTGLGLYVVRQVARAHGGLAECESKPGEWTSFRLVVPFNVPRPKTPNGTGNTPRPSHSPL